MELLLNLAWLLLALPACWLWRGSISARAGRKFSSLQCLLAMGCLLVILFPVVSATDDLRAMRTEMEESPVSKKSLRSTNHDKTSAWKWQSSPALVGSAIQFVVAFQTRQKLSNPYLFVPAAPADDCAGRSPPRSCLG